MEIRFTKMHGIGNDYLYFDGINQEVPVDKDFIAKITHRHKGVGADGIIVILPSDIYDFKMRMFNIDGSEAMMCGNGVRCFAKFCYDKKLTDKKVIDVETKSGLRTVHLLFEGENVVGARVDMQEPILETEKIPVLFPKETMIDETMIVDNKKFQVTAISMGNPHAVIFVDDLNFDLSRIGPHFEKNPLFPESVNTEFVHVINKNYVKMRVWERGSGETQACGTGACAVMVATHLLGKTSGKVTVGLLGGNLEIEYVDGRIWMEGEAVTICDGIYKYEKEKVEC